MLEKYQWISERYHELTEMISQSEVIADPKAYQTALKERSQLQEQADAWDAYQKLLEHLSQAQQMASDPDLRELAEEEIKELEKTKPVVFCGDLNVAHEEIDLKNPKTNHKNAGFTDEERGKMTDLLNDGFTDTFRYFYPEQVTYSWWSYRFKAREKNAGWRIDYFICSDSLRNRLKDAKIHTEVMGSDHCPVELDIE